MPIFSMERNPDSISVQALAEAFNNGQQEIQLPAFQRDAAWDEDHIELLWDSIFRGFPISSLLFAQADPQTDQTYKRIESSGIARQTNQSGITQFILIDGQQRSRAVALGLKSWQTGDRARLWVDLGKTDGTDKQANRFYICSLRKPWGTRTTDAMQREGLKALQITELAINDETLGKTWPMRATLPVPLAEILQNLVSGSSDWLSLVPASKQQSLVAENISNVLVQLRKMLEYRIPVYLMENPGMDDLGVIFERLNKQGVPMSEEDRFFSALKMVWPQAHDLVWEIHSDPETGRTLSPTKIVHLAVRLAAAEDNSDELSLSAATFKRFIRRQEQPGKANLEIIRSLLEPDDGFPSGRIHQGLRLVRQTLLFNPSNGNDDPGLPFPLAARLRPHVWHTLAAWAIHHEIIDAPSRLEMLRYACLDHFFTKTTAALHRKGPFEKAFSREAKRFPGKEIYQLFVANDLLSPQLILPDDFRTSICESPSPQWGKIQNETELIMWAQRVWLHLWFPYYDPTVFAGQDLPYDIDHIIPTAHLDMRGRRYNWPQIFWDYRSAVQQSPGNMRFWPKTLNRADGKNTLQAKHILGPADGPADGNPNLARYGLICVEDVRKASAINLEDLGEWELATNQSDVYNWSAPDRIRAFRRAVDKRRSAIYQDFFDRLGFKEWLEK